MNIQTLLILTLSFGSPVKVETLKVFGKKTILEAPIVSSIEVSPPSKFYLKGDTLFFDTTDTNAQYQIVYKSVKVKTPEPLDTTDTGLQTRLSMTSNDFERIETEPSFNLSGIKTVGVLGGTNRSTTLNQILDIRIHGQYAGYQVEGIINDQNLSYQETERLRNIDKVYLRVTGRGFLARIGDLEQKDINQNLKLRGFTFDYKVNETTKVGFTYGVEDGTPVTVEFHPQPAKLGPYYIDPDGNPVRIVPSSERVFLNGILLKRGINKDYTVDELIGTITFNPKWTFSESDVIRVEYQKLTSIPVTEYIETQANLYNASMSIIQEGANTELLRRMMSPSQVEYLKALGDTSGFVWIDGGRYVGIGNGNYELRDSIYEYVGELRGSYVVHFEYVGDGKGDYVFDPQLGAYKFVGKNIGNYTPAEKIEVPDRKRYLLLRWNTNILKKVTINLNLHGLQHNRNTFAKITPKNSIAGYVMMSFKPNSALTFGIYSYLKGKQFVFLNREKLPTGFSYFYGIPSYKDKHAVHINEVETSWEPNSGLTLRAVFGRANLGKDSKKRVSGGLTLTNDNTELEINIDRVTDNETQMVRASLSSAILKGLPIYPVIKFWREHSDTSKNTFYGIGLESKGFRIVLKYYLEKRLTVLSSTGNGSIGLIKFTHNTQVSRIYPLPLNYALNLNWRLKNLSGTNQITTGSLAERRATYRYVGPGQGDYTYDPIRKEYIPDPNGDFIRVEMYSGAYTSGRIHSHSLNYYGMVHKTSIGVSMSMRFQGQNQSYFQSMLNVSKPGRLSPHLNLDFVYRLTSDWKEVLTTGSVIFLVVPGIPSVSTEIRARYHEVLQQYVLRNVENAWWVKWQGRFVWQLFAETGYAISEGMRAITIGTGYKTRSQNLLGFYFDSYFKVRYASVIGIIPSALGFLIEPGPSLNASIGIGKSVSTQINISSYLSWWFSRVRQDLIFSISASTRF